MNVTANKIFKAIQEVLEVVEINDFINHIYNYRDNYKKSNLQEIVIQKIISETCESVSVPVNDVLNTKYNHNGKRIMAIGIIGMLVKAYFPQLSFERICLELNNNVNSSNLQRYIKVYKDLKAENKYDKETVKMIDEINFRILNYIKDEKIRIQQQQQKSEN